MCCAEAVNTSEHMVTSIDDIDLSLMCNHTDRVFDASRCIPPEIPFIDGLLVNILVDPNGVIETEKGLSLQLCHHCSSSLSQNKLPRLAMANLNFLGPVPQEMRDLTIVEEMLIARCRAKQCVVKLQDH